MRTMFLICFLLGLRGPLAAAETVSVPWDEFKTLFTESLERRFAERIAAPAPARQPQVHTLDEAVYQMTLGPQSVAGKVLISGRVISGDPAPIPLFGRDLIIEGDASVRGGSLITTGGLGASRALGIMFLPDGAAKEFQIELAFMAAPREDNRSRTASFAIPAAIRNTLRLTVPQGLRLLEAPGLTDTTGTYHFSLEETMTLRFAEESELEAAAPIEIDTFSRIQPQGRRMIVTTQCAPAAPAARPILMQLPREAQFLSSSLKPSWIARQAEGAFEIRLPPEERGAFSIQWAVDEAADGSIALQLPAIKDNNGKEGDFVVEEPDDGQVSVSGKGLVTRVPAARLRPELAALAGRQTAIMHIPAGEAIRLELKRFQAVSAPPIVLDTQYFFTSFEENGSVLSVLVMELPPEAGPRITLKAVAGAQVWSLKVNGQARKVYAQDETWVIPLAEGEPSRVELSLLTKGEKLGLQGRLETTLPETGLAARNLSVGIALPPRVQLISVEGPVSPAPCANWKLPEDFIGKPYLFSRSFHKGEGMKIGVAYKEPVK